jgi:hypothetical protein
MANAETDARIDAGRDAGANASFGGLTPSEAAQRRWAKERGREASAVIGNADNVPTDAEIVAALRRKAETGDAAAARELREWRAVEAQTLQGDAWIEVLDRRERRIVRHIIQRALARAGHPVTPGR